MTPNEDPIHHREHDGRGEFYIERDGRRVGELTYTGMGGAMVVGHTWVDPKLRGGRLAPSLVQAAVALGLARRQVLMAVELPLAVRTILAGVKTSAVISVGTATIAAFIGAGGFGERIAQGLALNDNATLLAGAIPAAGLALAVQGAFELAELRLGRPARTPA